MSYFPDPVLKRINHYTGLPFASTHKKAYFLHKSKEFMGVLKRLPINRGFYLKEEYRKAWESQFPYLQLLTWLSNTSQSMERRFKHLVKLFPDPTYNLFKKYLEKRNFSNFLHFYDTEIPITIFKAMCCQDSKKPIDYFMCTEMSEAHVMELLKLLKKRAIKNLKVSISHEVSQVLQETLQDFATLSGPVESRTRGFTTHQRREKPQKLN